MHKTKGNASQDNAEPNTTDTDERDGSKSGVTHCGYSTLRAQFHTGGALRCVVLEAKSMVAASPMGHNIH